MRGNYESYPFFKALKPFFTIIHQVLDKHLDITQNQISNLDLVMKIQLQCFTIFQFLCLIEANKFLTRKDFRNAAKLPAPAFKVNYSEKEVSGVKGKQRSTNYITRIWPGKTVPYVLHDSIANRRKVRNYLIMVMI